MQREDMLAECSDILLKIVLALGLGWLMVMGFQGYIWLRTSHWMPIAFGETGVPLARVLVVCATISFLLRWGLDRLSRDHGSGGNCPH
jgi:hypothetical protein